MDVSNAILKSHQSYGGSDNTNAKFLSASKSLNFSSGSSIEKATIQRVTAFPIVMEYKGAVGLFGSENAFIKFELNITDSISLFSTLEGPDGFYSMVVSRTEEDETVYNSALENYASDNDQNYLAALYNSGIKSPDTARISVGIENLGIGNQYLDRWLDVSFYDRERRPVENDLMYIKPNDFFYVGLHARKTINIPYDVKVTVGEEYLSVFNLTEEQKRYEG